MLSSHLLSSPPVQLAASGLEDPEASFNRLTLPVRPNELLPARLAAPVRNMSWR